MALAYYSYYSSYSSSSITYTGMAMGFKDGEYKFIPVSECEFGCAVNGICGTDTECTIGSIVMIVVGVIFGVIFLAICCVICCVCCAGVKGARKVHRDSSSSSSDSDRKKPLLKDHNEAVHQHQQQYSQAYVPQAAYGQPGQQEYYGGAP